MPTRSKPTGKAMKPSRTEMNKRAAKQDKLASRRRPAAAGARRGTPQRANGRPDVAPPSQRKKQSPTPGGSFSRDGSAHRVRGCTDQEPLLSRGLARLAVAE